MTNSLANISKARRALETAKSLDDVLQIRDQARAVETFVKAAKESLAVSNQASEIKVRAERKAGEMIAGMKKAKPGPKKITDSVSANSKQQQLESIGLQERQARRFEEMARVPDDKFEELASAEKATAEEREITSRSIQEAAKKPHVSNNSGENEWYTPACYIDAARKAMGSIDLDPASSKVAQETVSANDFYTVEDDGLSRGWFGNVWLNPPYSKGLIEKFAGKLAAHVENGDVSQAVLLVNNATDTLWFQDVGSMASAFCFPQGRIKFNDTSGRPRNTPIQGQAFMYFGGRWKTFVKQFRGFGICLIAHSR